MSGSQKSLRILLVVEPGIDGVFRHVEGLTHYLLDRGQEVHLAYSDRRGSPELIKLVEHVKSKGGRCLNLGVSSSPQLRDASALYRLARFAKQIKPGIIHGHSSKAGVLSRTLYFLGIPADYFYTPNAYYGLSFRPGKATQVYNGIESFFARVGTTINISEDEHRFALDKLKVAPDRSEIIHNPVDTQTFRPVPIEKKLEQRRKLRLPENAVIIGSMGRLSFQKDPATLYHSFAAALKKGIDLRLLHVGQGELNAEIESLARSLNLNDRLIRFPYFHNPIEFYSAIDAFIITSRYEAGWPIVVLEALACDLPVICGTGPGTSNLPGSGLSHCWTAPVGDVDGFAKAISDWFADRTTLRPSNHRSIALERFSPEKCFGAVLGCYESALNVESRTSG